MAAPIYIGGQYQNRTDSGAVGAGPIDLIGFYVNNTAGGTIVFADGATTVTGTITPVIGFHELPIQFSTSCTVTIAVAGLNVTFFYSKSKAIANG